jgi:hypothetical protein
VIHSSIIGVKTVALIVLSAALAGCAVSLRTAPAPAPGATDECLLARISGVLAEDADSGLGLLGTTGAVRGVVWPFGFSARRELSGIVLFDRAGRIVGHEGDNIQMTGGYGNGDVAYPCYEPHLEVLK